MMKDKFKLIKIVLIAIAIIAYSVGIIVLVKGTAIDADKANHLLQAADIVSGNFFLKNWILTGITFFTTDLFFYEVGYVIAGISNNAIYIANGLMIAVLTIVSFIVACKRNSSNNDSFSREHETFYKWIKIIIFTFIMAIPNAYILFNCRVHTGAVIICFVSVILFDYLSGKEEYLLRRKNIVLTGLLFVLIMFGTNGDKLFVLQLVIPVLIICVYRIIVENIKVKQYLALLITSVLGTIAGFVFESLYFLISNADRNSYIETVHYSGIYDWSYKFYTLIEVVMNYFNANFSESLLGDKWALIKVVSFLILIVAVIIWARIIVLFVLRKMDGIDDVSALIAFSVLIAACTFIFTSNSHAKYVAIIPFGLIIILIRNLNVIFENIKNLKIFIAMMVFATFAIFVNNIHDVKLTVASIEKDRSEVVNYLEEKELANGYSAFWNASVMTIASDNNVKVRHIRFEDGRMKMFKWFCRNDWYGEDARFIIVREPTEHELNQYGIDEETVIFTFGEPIEKTKIGEYTIYIFDYNISERIFVD